MTMKTKFKKASFILAMALISLGISGSGKSLALEVNAQSPASTQVSQKVKEIKASSKFNDSTKAKPTKNEMDITILLNGRLAFLTDPLIMENGRILLPVRALGILLGIDINYDASEKVAIATNDKAHLELPLGYNKAVKNRTIILPIDASNSNTRIVTYNSRTYLPVRFISENLGYQIAYANQTVSITTDGSTPNLPKQVEKTPYPNYKGTKNKEISKDGKWLWFDDHKEWVLISPDSDNPTGGITYNDPIDLNGPDNGNWQ